jgi:transmembrane sensor
VDTETNRSAAEWLARVHSPDCTPSERSDFERWLAADPRNRAAFTEMERLYARSADLRDDALIRATARRIRRGSQTAPWKRYATRIVPPLAAAALIALAIGIRKPVEETRYVTAIGEQRSVILPDGSTIVLDTNSAVVARVQPGAREVTLERGQVQFQVVHDPAVPFTVLAGDGVVHDIGTEFQVRKDRDQVTVTLIEGSVSVSAPAPGQPVDKPRSEVLQPGQQLAFDNRGTWNRQAADLKAAEGWTRGDLVFEQRPLGELIGEMNRYTQNPIRLGESTLATLRVSGVFHKGDQHSLLLALHSGWGLRADRRGDGEIILYRD